MADPKLYPRTHHERFIARTTSSMPQARAQLEGMMAMRGCSLGEAIAVTLASAASHRVSPVMMQAMHRSAMDMVLESVDDPTSYAELVRSTACDEYIRSLSALAEALSGTSMATADLICHVQTQWQTACFERYGKRTYVVSEGLGVDLALTELRGITGADLRLPYPSIYVQVPPTLGYTVDSAEGEHLVTGAYITEDKTDSARWTKVDLDKTVHEVPTDGGRSWRVLLTAESALRDDEKKNDEDDALQFFAISLTPEDVTIDDTLRETVEVFRGTPAELARGENTDKWLPIFRWLMNVVFYATSPDAQREHLRANAVADRLWRKVQRAPRNTTQRKRLQGEYRKLDPRERILLGRSIKVDRARQEHHASSLRSGKRDALLRRTLVPGHFQRYHTGEGRTVTVWKWKAPHIRNADAAIESSNLHVLGQ